MAVLCGLAGCGVLVSYVTAGSASDGANTGVTRPAGAAGQKLTDYQGPWWTWAATEPPETNPVGDLTGEHCGRNQLDDVWFLAGTFGGEVTRRCSVPEGTAILFPVINLFSGEPNDCADFMSVATGGASLNGDEQPLDRIDAETIVFTAAPDNVFELDPDTYEATACGLWVQIAALPAGQHELQIRGRS